MNNLIEQHSQQITTSNKTYKAKYAYEFFERKKIASYALWAIYVKDQNNRYPKLPTAYGRTETLEEALQQLTVWCETNELTKDDIRMDMVPWGLVNDLLKGKSGAEWAAKNTTRRGRKTDIQHRGHSDLVLIQGDRCLTTSLIIADKFNKRHADVLRAVRNLPDDDFRQRNFALTDFIDKNGDNQPMYNITWKGFSMLAMGFTGQKAYEWKRSFLDAFESMGEFIHRRQSTDWQEARANSKCIRSTLGVAVAALSKLADAQGGEKDRKYYSSMTKTIYKALFGDSSLKNVRDKLDAMQLSFLSICEQACANELDKLVEMGVDYHLIYKEAKNRVISTVDALSRTGVESKNDSVVRLAWENKV